MTIKKMINETEVEAEYGLTKPWLRKRRLLRDGPEFLRINRMILYERATLEKWLQEHVISTRERCKP